MPVSAARSRYRRTLGSHTRALVPRAKGSKDKDVQRSAMEVATYAQIKKLHKRLGFRDNANTQAVRANISHLWFAAQ